MFYIEQFVSLVVRHRPHDSRLRIETCSVISCTKEQFGVHYTDHATCNRVLYGKWST